MSAHLKAWLAAVAIAAIALVLFLTTPPARAAQPSPLLQQYAELATAAQPPTEFQMLLRLNGSPLKLGTIVSADGSTKNNFDTSSAFTLSVGDVIAVTCDAAAYCREGYTSSATITNAARGRIQPANEEKFWVLHSLGTDGGTANTVLACAGGAAFNCDVQKMR